ncbi:adenylyl-sulfate kinase [Chamaesiphon sp.]|uniref:adenylyl-sulfate kinase n=1 Tax=Chamaesiphon sp. TaxID=2814140 RepID=UPI003593A407
MLQQGSIVWFTGLSGAGKTTIARAVATELQQANLKVEILDGDVVRQHLAKELGFSHADRIENVRRIGFVANLLSRNGVIVLVAAIAPHRSIREELKQNSDKFLEVYVNSPLEVCERRDVKGLYAKARCGLIPNFTGIDMAYEVPLAPDLECQTDRETIAQSATKVLQKLVALEYIPVDCHPNRFQIEFGVASITASK